MECFRKYFLKFSQKKKTFKLSAQSAQNLRTLCREFRSQSHQYRVMSTLICFLVICSVLLMQGPTVVAAGSNETVYYEYNSTQNKFIAKELEGIKAPEIPASARAYGSSPHSQVGQDVSVLDILGHKKGGFFIDLASNDWKIFSNSLHLEMKYDWNGLCIEPNPQYYKDILLNRRCTLVANPVSHKTNDIVKFRFDSQVGGIVGKDMDNSADAPSKDGVKDVFLTTVTLDRVLTLFNAPHDIDYMSLDVEGTVRTVAES